MRKKFIKSTVLFLIILIVTSITTFAEDANNSKIEVNNKNIVDSISIEPKVLRSGDVARVKVMLSEKENGEKLTDKSILTLTKPEDLDLKRINREDNFYLSDNGTNIARVYTIDNQEKVVVEFLAAVNDGIRHKGEFFLDAVAQFPNPDYTPGVEQIRDFKTSLGSDANEADYTITYKFVVGDPKFFSKPQGRVDSDNPHYVTWNLHFNGITSDYSNIGVIDTFKSGQEFVLIDDTKGLTIDNLDSDYFNFTIDENNSELSVREFINRGFGTFEIQGSNTFEIKLNEKTLNNSNLTVYYRTRITQEGKSQQKFYNDALGYWKDEDGNDYVREDFNRSATNLFNGGIITPERYTLRVNKTANHKNDNFPLKDVRFKLYKEDGTPVILGSNNGEFTTDAKGEFSTPRIEPGNYYITEIFAPEHVEYDPLVKYPFEIKAGDPVGVNLNIINEVKTTSLKVNKVWNDKHDVYPTISINLLADNKVIDTKELKDGETEAIWTDLPLYSLSGEKIIYSISEGDLAGYTSVVSGSVEDGFKIVNTLNMGAGRISTDKISNVTEVAVNETFEYSIIVKNIENNSKPLKDVSVYDKLPEGISFTDKKIYLNDVHVLDANGDSFTYVIDEVAYGEDYIISFEVIANENAVSKVVNEAIVSSLSNEFIPEKPSVEVIVNPKDPKNEENLEEPQVPSTETDPVEKDNVESEDHRNNESSKTPITGVSSKLYLFTLNILIGLIAILSLKRKRTYKKH